MGDSTRDVSADVGCDFLYEENGFLVPEGYREMDGCMRAQAAREIGGMIYETCFLCSGEKLSAFLETDTEVGLVEGKNGVHGDGLVSDYQDVCPCES